MCKLSWNIVPNVYNSLQSSFLSLTWPWPGRSLLKGNQWEWWDPGKGPLLCLGEVGHSPRGTSGSAGTLDWAKCGWAPSPPATPNAPLTPPTPLDTLMPPMAPWHPRSTQCPLCHLYPFWPLSTYTPCQPPIQPDTSCTPDTPLMPPDTPTPPRSPNAPLCHLYPIWPQSTYTPCQPLIHSQHPLMALNILTPPSFLTLSLCNWPSSWVCVLYNIPSVVVKNKSAVLWSSANFCTIS